MPQVHLIRILPDTAPQRDLSADLSRRNRGYTVQAVASTVRRACRFCGEYHRARLCTAPIRRGWGAPGWETEGGEARAELVATGSPSKDMQRRMATFAAPRSKTAQYSPASMRRMPNPSLTASGTPAKPQ